VIRCQKNSKLGLEIGNEIAKRITDEHSLWDFKQSETAPLLLILDRCDDAVTPILHQWTYQAMIHELIGINNNRVDLSSLPNISKQEQKEIVLSTEQDPFYKANLYNNFGDLGANLKQLVSEFQSKSKDKKDIQTIQDMKKFVEDYPEFRKLSGNVSKHVTLMGELSRLVDVRSLFEVSELQQELACVQDLIFASAQKKLEILLGNPKIQNEDCLKLVLLYALRYEGAGSKDKDVLNSFKARLEERGIDREQIELISTLREYAGAGVRATDLFQNKSLISIASKTLTRGLKGVSNVYTEHKPLLRRTLESFLQGKFTGKAEANFPFINDTGAKESSFRPQCIIVFMIGGATFEEALTVRELNVDAKIGGKIVLGGTTVLNSASFLADITRVKNMK